MTGYAIKVELLRWETSTATRQEELMVGGAASFDLLLSHYFGDFPSKNLAENLYNKLSSLLQQECDQLRAERGSDPA